LCAPWRQKRTARRAPAVLRVTHLRTMLLRDACDVDIGRPVQVTAQAGDCRGDRAYAGHPGASDTAPLQGMEFLPRATPRVRDQVAAGHPPSRRQTYRSHALVGGDGPGLQSQSATRT